MLEKKAEENLLMLCEEKQKQQEMLGELKREILLQEREEKLNEALDKQVSFNRINAPLTVTQTHL